MTKQWQLRAAGMVLALAASAASHAQILIGQTAGFSGQVAAGVKETAEGALRCFDRGQSKSNGAAAREKRVFRPETSV